MSVSEQLRRAIVASGLTLYRIAQDAEVEYASLHRFVHGDSDVKLSTVDRLTEMLGLELRTRQTKKGTK